MIRWYIDCNMSTLDSTLVPFGCQSSVSAVSFFQTWRTAFLSEWNTFIIFFIAPCVDCKIRSHGGHQIFTAAVRPWNWIQAVCVEMCKKINNKIILSLVFVSALPLSCFFFHREILFVLKLLNFHTVLLFRCFFAQFSSCTLESFYIFWAF